MVSRVVVTVHACAETLMATPFLEISASHNVGKPCDFRTMATPAKPVTVITPFGVSCTFFEWRVKMKHNLNRNQVVNEMLISGEQQSKVVPSRRSRRENAPIMFGDRVKSW